MDVKNTRGLNSVFTALFATTMEPIPTSISEMTVSHAAAHIPYVGIHNRYPRTIAIATVI